MGVLGQLFWYSSNSIFALDSALLYLTRMILKRQNPAWNLAAVLMAADGWVRRIPRVHHHLDLDYGV